MCCPQLLTWAAYSTIKFTGGPENMTMTAIMDLNTLNVTLLDVTNTHHDMFCPGALRRAARLEQGHGRRKISISYSVGDSQLAPTYLPLHVLGGIQHRKISQHQASRQAVRRCGRALPRA